MPPWRVGPLVLQAVNSLDRQWDRNSPKQRLPVMRFGRTLRATLEGRFPDECREPMADSRDHTFLRTKKRNSGNRLSAIGIRLSAIGIRPESGFGMESNSCADS
ncbi:MAG: hypothetical protein ACKV2Q_14370 [Planctomycetaceae bacterium]